MKLTEKELREFAKDEGVKKWHLKSIETLKAELGIDELDIVEAEEAEAEEVTEVVVEEPAPEPEPKKPAKPKAVEASKPVLVAEKHANGEYHKQWIKEKDLEQRLADGWIKV